MYSYYFVLNLVMDTSQVFNDESNFVNFRNVQSSASDPNFAILNMNSSEQDPNNYGQRANPNRPNSFVSKRCVSVNNPPLGTRSSATPILTNLGSKNGSMVLQLVLPPTPNRRTPPDINYFANTPPIDEAVDSNGPKRRASVGSQQDLYSSLNNSCYINQGYSNEFSGNFALDAPSPVSLSSRSERDEADDKKRAIRRHLTCILSSMYALFVVTLGVIVYISDVFIGNTPMAEAFSLLLVSIALAFILYLINDIRRHVNRRNRHEEYKENNNGDHIRVKETPGGLYELNITLPETMRMHQYCFNKDRHSANFYLKIGAAGFCIGHLIHSGLVLGYQILFLTSDGESFYECSSVINIVLDISYPIYSFFLLYFMFKYANVVINRRMAMVRFGLMHCISSSLCFWIWTILRETIEALSNHEESENPPTSQPVALPLNSYGKKGAHLLKEYLNKTMLQFEGHCKNDAGLSIIYRNYSPYLYPFSVEYSILVVGILFTIWQRIGKCEASETSQLACDSRKGSGDNLESNVVIHADCHSANKGLFGGIVVMVFAVVSIILFFIAINDERTKHVGAVINVVTISTMTLLMGIAGVFAYHQINKLNVNHGHVAKLDDLLLFVCIPAFFFNGVLTIWPAIVNGDGKTIAVVVIEILQILVQTPLIIDGLKRCSNTKKLRKEKPGRELLTFLVVSNVALWITQTFEVKSHDLNDMRFLFYGEEFWIIVGHMCIPLIMFYRFHSSVCLADIWKFAYEPSQP